MSAPTRTLVLLDPSTDHGEAALDLSRADADPITLLLVLDGPAAAALEAFAASEGTTVAEAGDIYLGQVEQRLATTRPVDARSLDTHDPLPEIIHLARTGAIDRVAVPARSRALPARSLASLTRSCPVPVVVAPAAPARRGQLSGRRRGHLAGSTVSQFAGPR